MAGLFDDDELFREHLIIQENEGDVNAAFNRRNTNLPVAAYSLP